MSSNIAEIAIESGHGLHDGETRRRSRRLAPGVIGVCLVMVLASSLALVLVPGARASPGSPYATVKVPCGASIQAAINAAHPGDTIVLAKCTYTEQLTITKSITIMGAGAGRTIIQSPAVLGLDAFGNPWTIEIGGAATVAMSGFTLVVTPQCIISSPGAVSGVSGYAGGGIGVGGSATLNLRSAVVTTTGQTEGAPCDSGAGFMSYGTGVDFGLDYVTGSPAASQLVGFGTVSGVTVYGFGFGGPEVAVGGVADSPAGSYALISNDRITATVNQVSGFSYGVGVGLGGYASSATIVDNVLTAAPGTVSFTVWVGFGSSAYIAHNWIAGSGWADAVTIAFSASATITGNAIAAVTPTSGYNGIGVYFAGAVTITYNSISAAVAGWGIYLDASSATIEFNTISQFECSYSASELASFGITCGPDWYYQDQGYGIMDYVDAGLGTTIANNLVYASDVGVVLLHACPGCVVKDNVVQTNYWGLAGIDGTFTFSHDTVIGGEYGVAAIADGCPCDYNAVVTLDHFVMFGQTGAPPPLLPPPFYYEVDPPGLSATIGGTWSFYP